MDDNRLDALAYPVTRRIAPPRRGGNQIGSNAGLSAQTGLPAINVPAGFTPGGFPVGIELLGRAFAEPTLIGLAYSFEQATRHRASSASRLRCRRQVIAAPGPAASTQETVAFDVTATGASPLGRPFTASARFRFDTARARWLRHPASGRVARSDRRHLSASPESAERRRRAHPGEVAGGTSVRRRQAVRTGSGDLKAGKLSMSLSSAGRVRASAHELIHAIPG